MTPTAQRHEAEVAARFDLLARPVQGRGRPATTSGSRALRDVPRAAARAGASSTSAAARGGSPRGWRARGPRWSGSTCSAGDARARPAGLDRVRGSARRLPFADGDVRRGGRRRGVRAPAGDVDAGARRGPPGAPAGGTAGDRRQERRRRWNARRPWLPNLVVKWIDERRGRWMYPAAARSASAGSGRGRFARPARAGVFDDVRVEYLLSPEEAGRRLFRRVPAARLMTLWTARVPGGDRCDKLLATDLPPLPLLLWETPPGLELILAPGGGRRSPGPRPAPAGVPGRPVRALRRPAGRRRRRSAPRSRPTTSRSTSTCSAGRRRSTRSRPWSTPGRAPATLARSAAGR